MQLLIIQARPTAAPPQTHKHEQHNITAGTVEEQQKTVQKNNENNDVDDDADDDDGDDMLSLKTATRT